MQRSNKIPFKEKIILLGLIVLGIAFFITMFMLTSYAAQTLTDAVTKYFGLPSLK